MRIIKVDCLIIGAGVAGLWLHHRLSSKGFSCITLEKEAIGAGQTLKSQGIIHGGTKYALKGVLTNATSEIAKMTQFWHDCVQGMGEVDLSGVRILSDHHYLWTKGHFATGLKSVISSKLLSSHSDVVNKADYPPVFNHADFSGSLCRMQETVFDVPSLIEQLAVPYREQVLDASEGFDCQFGNEGQLVSVRLTDGTIIEPSHTFMTAAGGNETLLKPLNNPPLMQRRPLHMVYLIQDELPAVYAHCVEKGTKPRLTITTHPTQSGRWAWYLGGELAESGNDLSAEAQIGCAKSLLKDLLPWVDVSQADFATIKIDRCEGKMPKNKRPDLPVVKTTSNMTIVWPTKLTFAPLAAKLAMAQVRLKAHYAAPDLSGIKKAPLGVAPWNSY